MPAQVAHWRRILDFADPSLKSAVEQQIVSEAYRVLGDFRKKTLLSLPPTKLISGELRLGTVLYEKLKWPAGLSTRELLQNLAIYGRSGAGKTNVAFILLQQIAERGVPFLFLDWKRTARHLLPNLKRPVQVFTPGRSLLPFTFNPFIVPPGLESVVYINQIVDVLSDAFTLGDGSRSLIQRTLALCQQEGRIATPEFLLELLGKIPDSGKVRAWKASAVRALESLAFSKLTAGTAVEQEALAKNLLRQNTIIELDGLSQNGKRFLVPMLCLWLYYVKLASPRRENLDFVIVVEEAHHVLYRQEKRAKETLMNMLLRQCRELGIGIVVVDQHPHLISSAALGNTFTSICLNLKDSTDINRAAGLSMLSDAEKPCLSTLPVGQAVVKLQDRWRYPFLVQFPLVRVNKGAVTDELLQAYMRELSTGSRSLRFGKREFERVQQIQAADSVLEDNALAFLQDVASHRDDGIKLRYKRLGLSVGRGNAIKQQLVINGWLNSGLIPVGKSRKLVLKLTPKANELFPDNATGRTRESVSHEFWKRFTARRFSEEGYRVELEAKRLEGEVDVLAQRSGETIAVEIETGTSDVVKNVRQNLRSGFSRVLVVATDNEAMRKVERALGAAGLLIKDRVEIVLRDRWSAGAA